MKNTTLALLALAAPAFAVQDAAPTPAKQLKAFAPMIGHWEGSGTLVEQPGAEAIPWTATIDVEHILGGHVVQEQIHVDIGEMIPGGYHMKSLYAYDAEAGRLVNYGVNNMGEGKAAADLAWVDGKTLVSMTSGNSEIGLVSDRSIASIDGNSWDMRIERAIGAGQVFTHVTGSFEKKAAAAQNKTIEASMKPIALAPTLSALQPLVGEFSIEGKWRAAPEVEPMEVTGVETLTPIWGGTVVQSSLVGHAGEGAPTYEGIGFMVFNPEKGCFNQVFADNMGVFGISECRAADDNTMIVTHAGTMGGEPYAERSVLTIKNGKLAHVASDRLAGSGKAVRMFEGSYTPVTK